MHLQRFLIALAFVVHLFPSFAQSGETPRASQRSASVDTTTFLINWSNVPAKSPLRKLTSGESLECKDQTLYYVGKGTPSANGLKWERIGFPWHRKWNVPQSLLVDGNKGKIRRAYVDASVCGHPIKIKSKGKVFYAFSGSGIGGPKVDRDTTRNCLGSCGPCGSFQRFRLVYDLANHELCATKWKRRWGWQPIKFRIIRPWVNEMMDVKILNYNPLRDSIALEYQYENLNQENSTEFVNAILTGPSLNQTPTSVPVALDTTTKGGEKQDADGERNTTIDAETCNNRKYMLRKVSGALHKMADEIKGKGTESDAVETAFKNAMKLMDKQLDLSADTIVKSSFVKLLEECNADQKWGADTLKAIEEQINMIGTSYVSIRAKIGLEHLQQAHDSLAAILHVEAAKTSAPDREALRAKLDQVLLHFFPKEYDPSSDRTPEVQLAGMITRAKDAGIFKEGEQKKWEAKLDALGKNYHKMTTYVVFAMAPIQMHDYDLMRLQFKVNGKALNNSSYEFYAKGGWKVDFSTGFVVTEPRDESFFYSAVRTDTTVSSQTNVVVNGTDTSTTISETRTPHYHGTIGSKLPNQYDWGLTVLAHFYPRTSGILNISATLGALVRQDGVSPMGGVSLLFGRKQRFAATWGAILNFGKRLKPGFEVGGEYDIDSNKTVNTEVPDTERYTSFGQFISFTYNFAGARLTR